MSAAGRNTAFSSFPNRSLRLNDLFMKYFIVAYFKKLFLNDCTMVSYVLTLSVLRRGI